MSHCLKRQTGHLIDWSKVSFGGVVGIGVLSRVSRFDTRRDSEQTHIYKFIYLFRYNLIIYLFIYNVNQYLAEPPLSRQDDPLGYWATRRQIYPNLYEVAKQFLCTPASSVPCERVFSKAGEII